MALVGKNIKVENKYHTLSLSFSIDRSKSHGIKCNFSSKSAKNGCVIITWNTYVHTWECAAYLTYKTAKYLYYEWSVIRWVPLNYILPFSLLIFSTVPDIFRISVKYNFYYYRDFRFWPQKLAKGFQKKVFLQFFANFAEIFDEISMDIRHGDHFPLSYYCNFKF